MKRFVVGPSQLGWLRAIASGASFARLPTACAGRGGPPDVFNLADGAMKRRFDGGPEVQHDLGVGPPSP
jgi:hypothetical protein